MARIERATSPLPRGCSTTEPHGHRHRLDSGEHKQASDDINATQPTTTLERETGIEPASSAWKAGVLPLNYSRPGALAAAGSRRSSVVKTHINKKLSPGGGGWIRTSVGVSQQIYSLPPLATRAPLRSEPESIAAFVRCSGEPRHKRATAPRRSVRPCRRASAAGSRPAAARDGGSPSCRQ